MRLAHLCKIHFKQHSEIKAFWQIRIREPERHSLKFHWIKNLDPNIVEINRFTRLVFGLTQSSFILGTLKQHFQNYMNEYRIVVQKIQRDMYVDDLGSGGTNLVEVENLKQKSIGLFSNGGFHLHGTGIYQRLKMIMQLVNKHTPNNYSVVILVIQKYLVWMGIN